MTPHVWTPVTDQFTIGDKSWRCWRCGASAYSEVLPSTASGLVWVGSRFKVWPTSLVDDCDDVLVTATMGS